MPMNDCRDTRALLIDYAAGRLDRDERARVETHLEGCATCRDGAAVETALEDALDRRLPRYPAPAALKRALEARFDRAGRRRTLPAPAKLVALAPPVVVPRVPRAPLDRAVAVGGRARRAVAVRALAPRARPDAARSSPRPCAITCASSRARARPRSRAATTTRSSRGSRAASTSRRASRSRATPTSRWSAAASATCATARRPCSRSAAGSTDLVARLPVRPACPGPTAASRWAAASSTRSRRAASRSCSGATAISGTRSCPDVARPELETLAGEDRGRSSAEPTARLGSFDRQEAHMADERSRRDILKDLGKLQPARSVERRRGRRRLRLTARGRRQRTKKKSDSARGLLLPAALRHALGLRGRRQPRGRRHADHGGRRRSTPSSARPDFIVFTGDLTHTTDDAAVRRSG